MLDFATDLSTDRELPADATPPPALRLRRATPAEAPALLAFLLRNGNDTDLDAVTRDLEAIEREERETYSIYLDGELVGSAGLDARDEPYVYSLWWFLDSEHTDLIEEIGATLVRHAMHELGALRIELYCNTDNDRGREIARRLGFRRDGRVRLAAGAPPLERHVLGGSPAHHARARATFSPLARYLATRFDVTAADDTSVEIDWRNDRGAVTIAVTIDSACDRPWLVVSARVGDADLIAPADALAHNARLAMGALVLVGDRYILRYAAPLDGAAGWSLRQCVELLGDEAIRLAAPAPARGPLSVTPGITGAVDNYAD